ncbi:hypothetical protein Leryth_000075 [Lithospermum erythrorhizon]|nr:hypothetical protein Leryth_000075 [Lithospermum erythrorhizon]
MKSLNIIFINPTHHSQPQFDRILRIHASGDRTLSEGKIMAGGGNFIHRVLTYVANELIVNGLANSPAFQRFAVRSSKRMEDLANIAVQKKKEIAEQVKDLSKNMESSFKDKGY